VPRKPSTTKLDTQPSSFYGQSLALQPQLTSNLRSSCLGPLNAKIIDVCCHSSPPSLLSFVTKYLQLRNLQGKRLTLAQHPEDREVQDVTSGKDHIEFHNVVELKRHAWKRKHKRYPCFVTTCFHENQPCPVGKALISLSTAQPSLKSPITRLLHLPPSLLSMQDLDLAVSVSFRRSQTSLLTLDLLQLFGASVENFLSSVSTNS
jgi:hypothetical protein